MKAVAWLAQSVEHETLNMKAARGSYHGVLTWAWGQGSV